MTDFAHIWTDLPWWGWIALALSALVIGFAKTSIGNMAMLAVVVFAQFLPTKDSTGAVLLLLLVGDVVACWLYRRDVDWKLIGNLIIPVAVGLGLGALFLIYVDDTLLKRSIGIIVLLLLLAAFWPEKLSVQRKPVTFGYGSLAGFTTMVANAGGPAMSLYLLAAKFEKMRFLGTTAWYFFAVNAVKVPISISVGIIRSEVALLALLLAPVVLLGTWLGRIAIKRMDQKLFERLVTIFVAVSALFLLFA